MPAATSGGIDLTMPRDWVATKSEIRKYEITELRRMRTLAVTPIRLAWTPWPKENGLCLMKIVGFGAKPGGWVV